MPPIASLSRLAFRARPLERPSRPLAQPLGHEPVREVLHVGDARDRQEFMRGGPLARLGARGILPAALVARLPARPVRLATAVSTQPEGDLRRTPLPLRVAVVLAVELSFSRCCHRPASRAARFLCGCHRRFPISPSARSRASLTRDISM